MTSRPSWRSTLETWAVQAVDAADPVVAAVDADVVLALASVVKPRGRPEEELTR